MILKAGDKVKIKKLEQHIKHFEEGGSIEFNMSMTRLAGREATIHAKLDTRTPGPPRYSLVELDWVWIGEWLEPSYEGITNNAEGSHFLTTQESAFDD